MRRYLIYFPLLFLMVSCEIIEEDISGRAVTTIAPADDAEVPAGETLFRWRAVDRATGYELCVATEGRIVADTLLAADTLGLARSYGCRLRLEAGRYEWTVAAFNSGYETSSPALRLTVAEEPVSRSRRSRTIPNPPNREIALDDLSAARSRRDCLGRRGVADPRAGTTRRAGCPTRDRHSGGTADRRRDLAAGLSRPLPERRGRSDTWPHGPSCAACRLPEKPNRNAASGCSSRTWGQSRPAGRRSTS